MLPQGKGDVVKHTQIGEQGAELKQHAHAPARCIQRRLRHAADILAIKQNFAGAGFLLTAYQAQHRGLAAAGGAHQGGHFATRHAQAKVFENDTIPLGARVGEGHLFELNE